MTAIGSYIICTSPRSGSTMLCRMLRDSGVAGHPGSHFHEPSLEAWLKYYDLPAKDFSDRTAALRAVFDAAVRYGRGGTEVFGLRLQRGSFDFFMAQLAGLHPEAPDGAGRIEAAFGPTRYIHLTRRDKLRQAISFIKASQSGLWHRRADGSELERLSPPQPLRYDGDAIAAKLAEFTANDQSWANWFEAEGLSPHLMTYEDLSADPQGETAKALAVLGLGGAAPPEPSVTRLADEISEDWAARFLSEGRDE